MNNMIQCICLYRARVVLQPSASSSLGPSEIYKIAILCQRRLCILLCTIAKYNEIFYIYLKYCSIHSIALFGRRLSWFPLVVERCLLPILCPSGSRILARFRLLCPYSNSINNLRFVGEISVGNVAVLMSKGRQFASSRSMLTPYLSILL